MLTLLARFHCLCLGLLALGGCLAAAEAPGDGEGAFSRTRHKAAALALLCHNPTPSQKKDFACQKCCLAALCRMFVQEGGYYAARVPAILEIRDPETAHVGLLLRELDGALPTGAQPRTLQMACAVALASAAPSPSGVHAAVHAARLVEADVNNPAIARAAYSLLTAILGGEEDKERLLKIAVANADDYYDASAFRALADFLDATYDDDRAYGMVGYPVAGTLSDFGSVSRAVCHLDPGGNLLHIEERLHIERALGRGDLDRRLAHRPREREHALVELRHGYRRRIARDDGVVRHGGAERELPRAFRILRQCYSSCPCSQAAG